MKSVLGWLVISRVVFVTHYWFEARLMDTCMGNLLFLRLYVCNEPKYTSKVCHSLKNSYLLDFKNAEYDNFRNFKTILCKNYLIPGETDTRNLYSRVCRSKIDNCCLSVFFFCVGHSNHLFKFFEASQR